MKNSLSKLEQQEIAEALSQFGLNEKDRETYLALLGSGETTLTPLAHRLHCPVTTAQSAVGRLVDLGLVRVTARKSRRVYEAHDPAMLKRIAERQLQELAGVVPLLQKLRTEPTVSGKIQIYYRERTADIFHEALRCRSKLVYEIVSARDIQDVLGEKFHFTRRRIKEGIQLKSLRVESHEIKKYSRVRHVRELREAKFLPKELTFRGSIMFWDDTVAFFTTKGEGLAWTVESRSLRETFEQLFGLLWSVSRKMETASDEV